MFSLSIYDSFFYSSLIMCIGILIDSINYISHRKLYSDETGIFAFDLQKKYKNKYVASVYKTFSPLFSYRSFSVLIVVRSILCLIIICDLSHHYLLYIALFTLQLAFNVRNVYTLSGADQMQSIVLFGLTVCSLDIDVKLNFIALAFIGVHLVLSYFFTGFHKIRSINWRKGDALLLTFNSEVFGNKFVVDLLNKNRMTASVSGWFIMVFQLSFCILLIVNPYVAVAALAIGFIFHLTIAIFMNLNHFFWAYLSVYPVVLYLAKFLWIF